MNKPCDKPEMEYRAGTQPVPEPDKPFWMVYVPGRQWPAKQHYAHETALRAAERLARHEPDRVVYILEAVQYCTAPPADVRWRDTRK